MCMMTKVMSLRLPENIVSTLKEIAVQRNRKQAEIIREALEWYCEEAADYRIAVDRLLNPSDKVIDEAALREELDWDV